MFEKLFVDEGLVFPFLVYRTTLVIIKKILIDGVECPLIRFSWFFLVYRTAPVMVYQKKLDRFVFGDTTPVLAY